MSAKIVVGGFPPNVSEDKIIIYFQKRKVGGGDVRAVQMLDDGARAIVEFEEEKTVESVLKNNHICLGKQLHVERLEAKKVFTTIQALLSERVIGELRVIKDILKSFPALKLKQRHGNYLVESVSVEELQKFSDEVKEALKRQASNGPRAAPRSSKPATETTTQPQPSQRSRGVVTKQPKTATSSTTLPASNGNNPTIARNGGPAWPTPALQHEQLQQATDGGARRKAQPVGRPDTGSHEDASQMEGPPFPQPPDGHTFARVIQTKDENSIKRRFLFPAGQLQVAGQTIQYDSCDCTVTLPNNSLGKTIDAMLAEAFQKRKLFYIGKNRTGPGFVIYSAYELLAGKNALGEVNLDGKLYEAGRRLRDDLGIPTPNLKNLDEAAGGTSQSQHSVHPAEKKSDIEATNNPEPMETSDPEPQAQPAPTSPKKRGPFRQPEGAVVTSEFHDKDLEGFPGVGAIHIYFRFAGGQISDEDGQKINYLSYNRVACLPGNDTGRRLYGMIGSAVAERQLFVVARLKGEYLIRTKVKLLLSDDYPATSDYFEKLFEGLLQLRVTAPSSLPPLPPRKDSHYEEPSGDEDEEFGGSGQPLKLGPHPQPENGVMRMEKEDKSLAGYHQCQTINTYFRFAGGKMKIQGSKPSRAYEIPYSQLNTCASFPDNNLGRLLVVMVRSAFDQRKLFYIQKKEGEPAFRIRPHVTLVTADGYPVRDHLTKLRTKLKDLGIADPTPEAISSLVIAKSSMPQGGAVDPNWSTVNQSAAPDSVQAYPNGRQLPPSAFQSQHHGRRTATQPSSNTARNLRRTSSNPGQLNKIPSGRNAAFPQQQKSPSRMKTQNRPTAVKRPPAGIKRASSLNSVDKEEEEECAICLQALSSMPTKRLPCKHEFHAACVDMATKDRKKCPMCQQPLPGRSSNQQQAHAAHSPFAHPVNFPPNTFVPTYGGAVGAASGGGFGNQPLGTMTENVDPRPLPGFEGSGTIVINYSFPSGYQGVHHPNPGVPYARTDREAYLPATAEGHNLLRMLRIAFDGGLTFTIGRSQSSGKDNQIIWNGIPHKTNREGGRVSYGYPDLAYLSELRQALVNMGIQ